MQAEPRKDPSFLSHQEERCQFFASESTKPASILFMGDSIVEFFSLKKFLGYDLNLVNHGIAGTSAHWMCDHVDQVLAGAQPEQIFLLIGTNDIGMGYETEEIVTCIEAISNRLRSFSYGSRLTLISVLPVNEAPKYQAKVKIRRNNKIEELNRQLETLPGIEFADVFTALLDKQGQLAEEYTQEGLHLTQAGYAKLAQALKLYL
ncbi:MAG: SGNH/GDSL hydrolase family protein [Streptococcus sobrinus]